jgi:hypothetical protein
MREAGEAEFLRETGETEWKAASGPDGRPPLSVSLFLGTAVLLGIFSVPLDACMLRRQSGICLVLLNFIASIYFCEKKYWGDTGVCFLPWRIRD